MSTKKEPDIYTIFSDTLKMLREATHPLSKLVRKLILARGINKFSWDKLLKDHIKSNPTIMAKNPSKTDLSQKHARLTKHIANPHKMSFATLMKFASIVRATKIRIIVQLEWEDDAGNIIDRASAEVSELVTTKYDAESDSELADKQ